MQLSFNIDTVDDTPIILLNQTKKPEELKEIPSNYVITDVETTGLNPYKDSIIELCAIKVCEDKITEEFSAIIRPDVIIPDFIVQLTGITNEQAQGGETRREVLKNYCKFIGTFPIIGHNIKFDLSFINSALEKEFKLAYKNLNSYKLTNIANFLNIDTKNAHRALKDCKMTYEIIRDIKSKN